MTLEEKMAATRKYRIDRYSKLVDTVYTRRGWTLDGVPTLARLKELGLDVFPEVVGDREEPRRLSMIQVNGDPLEWQDGMTVRDVLTRKRFTFPMLVITVNDSVIDRKDYDTTVIPEGADVKVVHLMSGG